MGKYLFLLVVLCSSTHLFSHTTQLTERLNKAKNGDYFVYEANKMITLIAIRSNTNQTLLIEEISVPSESVSKRSSENPHFWNDWVKQRAPGHTSWAMIEIDTPTSRVIECYSFSKGAWVQLSSQESLFSTLLQLPLHPTPQEKRRRIGPPPQEGEPDLRQIWDPPLVYHGKKKEKARFHAFEATWPNDGSELSNKGVSLYFDAEHLYPLPFWIQVDTAHATAQVRAIDAGTGFISPHRNFPRRVPEFIGSPKRTKTGIIFSLKSPQYYRQFELYAIDITANKREICPIAVAQVEKKEELLTLQVSQEELEKTLQKDHRYTWLLVPVGYSESYTESNKPFTWH